MRKQRKRSILVAAICLAVLCDPFNRLFFQRNHAENAAISGASKAIPQRREAIQLRLTPQKDI